MRKLLRLSVLALATMFAGGAYAQDPYSLGLTDDDNLLYGVTWNNCNDHLWMYGYDNEQDDDVAMNNGVNSAEEKARMYRLIDGDSGTYTQSSWYRADDDTELAQFLDVYLDEKVQGPMIAYMQRHPNKDNGHVLTMDVWASDGSATKHGLADGNLSNGHGDFTGWEKIAENVSVSNPVRGGHGMTDTIMVKKPYKYFRFVCKSTNHGRRMNSFHMAEFKLFKLSTSLSDLLDPQKRAKYLLNLLKDGNLLKDVTWDNVDNYLWMNDYSPETGGREAEEQGPGSQASRDWFYRLIDGDHYTYVESDWENCDGDASLKNYLDVYLDEKVQGPMIAYIQRRAQKANNHVLEMDIFASNDAEKYVDSFEGWDQIAHVNVSNPGNNPDGSGKHGFTDMFNAEKPYRYFRFVTTKTDHGSRMNSFHMAEFKLFKMDDKAMPAASLITEYSQYLDLLKYIEEDMNIGTNYYQYSDAESYKKMKAALLEVANIINSGESLSIDKVREYCESIKTNYEKVLASQVLYQVPEAGYYRIEFVNKPGYCVSSDFLYGTAMVSRMDDADSRQLWYMEPAGTGKTMCVNAADGSFPAQAANNRTMCFTPRVYTRYVEGNWETNEFTTVPCSFDAVNDDINNPVVAMRPSSVAYNYVADATKQDYYGSYVSSNMCNYDVRTYTGYVSENEPWTNQATHVVLVRVPDEEAEKIIANSPYTAYAQLQELIEDANDLLDIAADAENCFNNDYNGELLKDLGSVSGKYTNAPRGCDSINVDLGSKVSGGVNVLIRYANPNSGCNPVEWCVYGTNDASVLKNTSGNMTGWTLLDPCYNGMFDGTVNCGTLPLNLGQDGYRYLRFVCRLSWSKDNWEWYKNTIQLASFKIYRARQKAHAEIEGEAAQMLLTAVQTAIEKADFEASQADVEALRNAINAYINGGNYSLGIEPFEAYTGSQISMPINMKNEEPIVGFQFDLYLPEGINLSYDEYDDPIFEATSRVNSKSSLEAAVQPDGSIRFLCYSTKNFEIEGTEGDILNIPLNIPKDMKTGKYPIQIKNIVLNTADAQKITPSNVQSSITVSLLIPGDANNDGSVDVADIGSIASYILGTTPAKYNPLAADYDQDGSVDVVDISNIANVILYGSSNVKAERNVMAEGSTKLYMLPFEITPGESKTIEVLLENPDCDVCGSQFCISLPKGLHFVQSKNVKSVAKGMRSDEMQVASTIQPDGSMKILTYSLGNGAYKENHGAIVSITVEADADVKEGEYEISLKDITLSTCDNKAIGKLELPETNTTATSIKRVNADNENLRIYNMNGQQMNTWQKGINIIENKKVLIK